MARQPRICIPGLPHHLIQRGNNRQVCFTGEGDLAAYAHWLSEGIEKFQVALHAWVFMTNHVHLLATPQTADALARLMQYVGAQYVRYFNHAYARTGTLYEGRYRSCVVQDDTYLLRCMRYIELNPVRAGLARNPGDFRWSSYRAHALGLQIGMWTPHETYIALNKDPSMRQRQYRELVDQSLDADLVTRIRHCANTGLVLGSEAFREQVAKMQGQTDDAFSL